MSGRSPLPVPSALRSRGAIYRPSTTGAFEKHIVPTLTWPEWVAVTAGYPWSGGSQFDRHNILAAELALRAAEYLPEVGAVLGEKLSTMDLYAGSGLGKEWPATDNRRADGTLVRNDGLRIAIEVTATASAALEKKVRRWAELLRERPLETSGLVVVFVAAPHPDRPKGTGSDPVHGLYRRIAKVLSAFPRTGADSPAARIGVVSWDEWFPARHELSEDFFTLAADFALADGAGRERWVRRGREAAFWLGSPPRAGNTILTAGAEAAQLRVLVDVGQKLTSPIPAFTSDAPVRFATGRPVSEPVVASDAKRRTIAKQVTGPPDWGGAYFPGQHRPQRPGRGAGARRRSPAALRIAVADQLPPQAADPARAVRGPARPHREFPDAPGWDDERLVVALRGAVPAAARGSEDRPGVGGPPGPAVGLPVDDRLPPCLQRVPGLPHRGQILIGLGPADGLRHLHRLAHVARVQVQTGSER
nr:hypothetical protein [Sinomonas gamaensis]